MKRMLIALAVCACAFGQTVVRTSARPAPEGAEELFYRDGSGNSEYYCVADSPSLTSIFSVTAALSLQPRTSISVVNVTDITVVGTTATVTFSGAHGLRVSNRLVVSGATVDTDLNGSYNVATVGSSSTLTFTVASVSAATYNEATLKISTTAPRSNSNVWSIQRNYYTGAAFDRSAWAYGAPSGDKACDSRTDYF
jgi:hypothetical protein